MLKNVPQNRETKDLAEELILLKIQVSTVRKYHNHTLQTNPGYGEEEPKNTKSHKTSGRQFK